MRVPSAPLEDWLRERYFLTEIDISSSGVEPYTMTDLKRMTGLADTEIDAMVFDDGYSLGSAPVRELLAARWGDGDPDKVMTANGSSESIALVLMALLRPSDEVVVVRPGYHSLVEIAAALGATTRTWRIDPDQDWQPSIDELAALVNERTRAIVVNFPQNPTGTSISEADLARLVDLARSVGAYLLWDAAFADLVYDTAPLTDVTRLYERGISFGTFSKAFGLPGLRFGWCVGPRDVLDGCVRIKDYTTLHVAPLIELLARRVLEHADSFLEPRMKQARGNREIVGQWADRHQDRISLVLPAGGVAAFPRIVGLADTHDFSEQLYQRHRTLVVPGGCFQAPRHVRLGFGGPTDHLVEGLDRFSSALADLAAPEHELVSEST